MQSLIKHVANTQPSQFASPEILFLSKTLGRPAALAERRYLRRNSGIVAKVRKQKVFSDLMVSLHVNRPNPLSPSAPFAIWCL